MTLSINSYGTYNLFNMMNSSKKSASFGLQSANPFSAIQGLDFSKRNSNNSPYGQFAKSAATGVANFLNASKDVQASAQKLTQKDNSAFQARTAESSDNKKVTANASAGAGSKSYEVKVDAVATSQTNSGNSLSKADSSVVSKGTNQFNITVGDKTTQVSANISTSDTNEQALNKLKDSINAAKTGVTASVVTDDKTGNKKLELTSAKTGTDQAFKVEDVTGNALTATGVATATQAATNASYSVNGGAVQTSQSNTIELEKGKATATLVTASNDAVKIQVKPDENKIVAQVKELVSSYNAMHDRLKEAGGVMNSAVRKSVESLIGSSTNDSIGILRGGDGKLKLDEEQLKSSLNTNFDQTARAISGNYGFADRIASTVKKYDAAPVSSLMNAKTNQVQQLAMYQSFMQASLQSQTSGLFMNLRY